MMRDEDDQIYDEAHITARLEAARSKWMFLLRALGQAKVKELEPQTIGLTAAAKAVGAAIHRLGVVLNESNDRAYAVMHRNDTFEKLGHLITCPSDDWGWGTVEKLIEEARIASGRAAKYIDRAADRTDEPDPPDDQ